MLIHDKPIIVHTIEKFQNSKHIDKIVVVCVKDYIEHMKQLKIEYDLNKIFAIVPGGQNGQESIFNGLVEIKKHLNH